MLVDRLLFLVVWYIVSPSVFDVSLECYLTLFCFCFVFIIVGYFILILQDIYVILPCFYQVC